MKRAKTSTVLSQGSRQISLQLSALAGVVAPIIFAVVFTLDGLVHPDYSAMRETISALSEERVNGWIQIANFFVFGLLLLAFLILGVQCVRIPAWRGYGWYTLLTFLATIGLFLFWIYTAAHAPQIAGLVERILFIVPFSWYVLTGGRFLMHFRARKTG